MKIYILPLFILSIFLCSCDKDNPSENNDPIVKRWNITRHIDTTVYFNGPTTTFDYQGVAGDYLDFSKDGKVYRSENGTRDTSAYVISNDTLTVTHKYAPYTTTFKIEVLTADSLQLNGRAYVITNSHDYRITHYYLKK